MLINYIFIPIIAAFFAYLLNKKGKYIGSIITSLISAYILYQLIGLYGNWSLTQNINLSIMGNELQLLFANNPLLFQVVKKQWPKNLLIATLF